MWSHRDERRGLLIYCLRVVEELNLHRKTIGLPDKYSERINLGSLKYDLVKQYFVNQ